MVLFSLSACNSENENYDEYKSQSEKYWEQTAEADRQLKIMEEQSERVDRLQKMAEEHLVREKTQLDRWDAILDRHEKVLSVMEKQHGVVE